MFYLDSKSAQKDNIPRAKNSVAFSQFCSCRASIKAIPKKITNTAKFVNFIFISLFQ